MSFGRPYGSHNVDDMLLRGSNTTDNVTGDIVETMPFANAYRGSTFS